MTEYWQRSEISGTKRGDGGYNATQIVLHRRGEDAMQMAMRRNPQLAACSTIEVQTVEAFTREIEEAPRRTQADIPRDDRQGEELEW